METLYSHVFKDLDKLEIELQVKVPKEMLLSFEGHFKVSYGDFDKGNWQGGEEDGPFTTLVSPTMSVYEGAELLKKLPDYADARITGLFRRTGTYNEPDAKNMLKEPIKAARGDPIYDAVAAAHAHSMGRRGPAATKRWHHRL
jgi:hypothetical protein